MLVDKIEELDVVWQGRARGSARGKEFTQAVYKE